MSVIDILNERDFRKELTNKGQPYEVLSMMTYNGKISPSISSSTDPLTNSTRFPKVISNPERASYGVAKQFSRMRLMPVLLLALNVTIPARSWSELGPIEAGKRGLKEGSVSAT